MLNNDFTRSDSRRGHQCPFTSVVILQKDLTGIVHACPVSDVNIIGSRTYSVKGISKQLSSNVIVLGGEDSSTPVQVTSVSSAKRVNRVLCILITVGGILLFTRHRRLIGLAKAWAGYLLLR